MYGMRRELARMREQVGGRSIMLNDGSRYRYNRAQTSVELFTHTAATIRAEYGGEPHPEPPNILRAVAKARDRRAAITQLYPEWEAATPFTAFDLEALADRGELVPLAFPPLDEPAERGGGV